jgi:hypothetical protein
MPPTSVAWLAFCSGSFLRTAGREIPAPLYHFRKEGGSDKTSSYDDAWGLPRRVEFCNSDDSLVCCYEVERSTNCCGGSFPLEFKVTQYNEDTWKPRARAVGKVTWIRKVQQFEVPTELGKAVAP